MILSRIDPLRTAYLTLSEIGFTCKRTKNQFLVLLQVNPISERVRYTVRNGFGRKTNITVTIPHSFLGFEGFPKYNVQTEGSADVSISNFVEKSVA